MATSVMNPLTPGFRLLPGWIVASLLSCSLLFGQAPDAEKEKRNPFAGDADAIAVGKSLFRCYCAVCHGEKGEGGFRGPDLIQRRLIRGSRDQDLLRVIKQGIQGTMMPPHVHPDENVWRIIAFIKHTRSQTQPRQLTGDWDSGRTIFFGKGFCSNCHMVRGEGGRFGPDLSRVGRVRSLKTMIESIRKPSARFRNLRQPDGAMVGGYEPVRLATRDGTKITGVIRNEDTFTIQVLDQKENFHSHNKSDLEEITRLDQSLMPAYPESAISEHELEDLLTFLAEPPEEAKSN